MKQIKEIDLLRAGVAQAKAVLIMAEAHADAGNDTSAKVSANSILAAISDWRQCFVEESNRLAPQMKRLEDEAKALLKTLN